MLDTMLSVGSVVAGYRIERVLGTGGMGTVYLAQNPTLPRREALKILDAELSDDDAFRERFVREADIVSQFHHPNIVSVYGRGETTDGALWIALQYVDGTDAEAVLRAGKMTPERAIHIVAEAAKALDYAHRRNVVHHDVKPGNLLLSGAVGDREKVYLSDFGVARPIEESDRTLDGALTATLAYSAPEVLTAGRVDGRADLYSLGCTLFRLLTGKQAYFQAEGVVETIRAHLQQTPPRVTDHLPWATPGIDAVIAKALAKNPAQRYASTREFAIAAAEAIHLAAPPGGAVAPYGLESPPSVAPKPAAPTPPPPPTWGAPRPAVERPNPIAEPPPRRQLGVDVDLPVIEPTPGPRLQMSKPRPIVVLWSAAAVFVVVAVVLVITLLERDSAPPPAVATPSTTSMTADAEVQAQLMRLLPAGYPTGSCDPAPLSDGARAVASCAANTDPGGPAAATYTLAGDATALRAELADVVNQSTQVVCPGNIQSPGPWRRNAAPTVVAGTLFCGIADGKAVIAWTTDSDLLLNFARGKERGLDALYKWWSTHS